MTKSVIELARERATALQASSEDATGTTGAPPPATGMMTSADSLADTAMEPAAAVPTTAPSVEEAAPLEVVAFVPREGDYKALRLGRFFPSNAAKIMPNSARWYRPENEEQAEMLAYYATKNGLVKAFTEEAGK